MQAGITPFASLLSTATPLPAGGYGSWDRPVVAFKNVAPRTRSDRLAARDRDHVEKERLKAVRLQRRDGFGGYVETFEGLSMDPSSSHYISSRERFMGDFASDERAARESAEVKRLAALARRKEEEDKRDAARWAAMAEAERAETEKWVRKAEMGGGRKNKTGMAYDPLTLAYHDTPAGQALKVSDDAARDRAAARSEMLASKGRSTEYNLLSGAPSTTSGAPGRGGVVPSGSAWGGRGR